MYAISFRIKVDIPALGVRQFVNGCCATTGSYRPGESIFVKRNNNLSEEGWTAEVIDSRHATRVPSDYGWRIV